MSDTDEITRLRAENERLEDENKAVLAANRDVMLHWDVLKADYERLRAALHIIAGDLHTSWQGDIARAALDGQPAPSGWRPIETAPKDGTEVLMVFVFEDDETLHRVVRWDGSEMWPWRDEYTGYREGEAKGWMPLPPAPGKEEA